MKIMSKSMQKYYFSQILTRQWPYHCLTDQIIFRDVSEQNNDYSDTLDFKRGWVGEVRVVTFFILEVPDYKSAMIIYFIYISSYDTGRSFDPIFLKFTWLVRVQSWVNPMVFGNNRPNRTTDMGENVPP